MNKVTKGLLAATALVSLPSLAQAAPVVTNVSILVPATTSGVYINLVTGLVGTSPAAVPGWDINPWGTGSLFFYSASTGGIVVSGSTPADLAAGAVIGAGSTYATNPGAATAFQTGGDHVFGFKFLNETTGITNYGYARITTTTSANGRPATITQLVYENTGAALTVAGAATGAVPEPATWAMMMMGFGAMGFAMRRKANVKTRVRFA